MSAIVGSLSAIVSIVMTWAVLCAAFVGVGLAAQRRLPAESPVADDLLDAFWIGFAIVVGFLQIWHLLFPIAVPALAIVVGCGVIAFVAHRRWIGRLVRPSRVDVLVLVLAAAWLANHSAGSPNAFDSAMYHMQAVRWANSYPVVPGLGNLHDRLAFNTSSILYFALLNNALWAGRGAHVANGLLVLVLLAQILLGAGRLMRGEYSARNIFDVTLLIPVFAISTDGMASSFLTDAPPAIVFFVAGSRLFRVLSASSQEGHRLRHDVLFTICLAVLAVCLKASSLTFAPLLVLVSLWHAWRGLPRRDWPGLLRTIATIVLVLGIPWVVHGTMLSGYPIYPSTIGGIPVEWRVPTELARAEATWIGVYARHSGASGLAWVRRWLFVEWHAAGFLYDAVLGMLLPLTIVVGMLFLRTTAALSNRRAKAVTSSRAWQVMIPVTCSLCAWFVLAPSPRFELSELWILAAVCAAQTLPLYRAPGIGLVAVAVLAAMSLLAVVRASGGHRRWAEGALDDVFLRPGPDHGLYEIETPQLTTFTTDFGLALSVPVRDNRCFDVSLPCTPHPAPNLGTRRLWDGRPEFMTAGEWRQLNWPNPDSRFGEEFRRRDRTQ